jgi:hypothetical protein
VEFVEEWRLQEGKEERDRVKAAAMEGSFEAEFQFKLDYSTILRLVGAGPQKIWYKSFKQEWNSLVAAPDLYAELGMTGDEWAAYQKLKATSAAELAAIREKRADVAAKFKRQMEALDERELKALNSRAPLQRLVELSIDDLPLAERASLVVLNKADRKAAFEKIKRAKSAEWMEDIRAGRNPFPQRV